MVDFCSLSVLHGAMRVRRLVDFPYVLVRLRCDACKRAGSYRLARLAVKFGAEILLDDLLVRLSADCPWRDDPRGNCEACPSEASARELAGRLAQTHVGVIAWSRTGDPDLGDWGPPEVLVWTGVIPDEFEAGGGVE
jgi:hypothetical protein